MARKRDTLSLLKRDELLGAADRFGLEIADRRIKADLVEALGASRRAPLAEILGTLSRDRLKELCRAFELDDGGREKALLVERLLGTSAKRSEEPSAPPAKPQGQLKLYDRDPEMTEETTDPGPEMTAIEDGMMLDYVTGLPVKDTPKEQVRQRIARALFHEYAISMNDVALDFKMKVEGRRKKIDLVVFHPDSEHKAENIDRVVICQKEPTNGRKGAVRMRDHEQAKKEFGLLHDAMGAIEGCRFGLWTNGLEFFFFEKKVTRFDVKYRPIGDWPVGDESLDTREVVSHARLRRAEPEMLKTAFRRCHNFIHGNEGMPKDAAFWQFLYLIFAKMHDEKRRRDEQPRFWAGPTEQFDPAGRKKIRSRIEPLFKAVKAEYSSIFRGNEEITLTDRALAFMVSELAKYDFGRTAVDAKGAAYQEIVGNNLRGDRGQYFTPRGAIDLMVRMLDPQDDERVMDPACGTGGFLVATLKLLDRRFHDEAKINPGDESTDEFLSIRERLAAFCRHRLFGADFDQFLVRAAQMNVVMASNAEANLYNMNSLEFPDGYLSGVDEAKEKADLGTMDVVMTNPPFGSGIPISDPNILNEFELAYIWERNEDGGFGNSGRLQGSVSPEVLFIERCIDWLKPGGRMGIVLPDGILGNPGDEYIRYWILRKCWVLASVDLPVETFIHEANVNILTSLLFLKKKTREEIQDEDLGQTVEYPVFMAIAEKVGFDRRGNKLYKRSPDGEEILEEVEKREKISIRGREVVRTLRRKQKIIDNDLPRIGDAYAEFRAENPEPGT